MLTKSFKLILILLLGVFMSVEADAKNLKLSISNSDKAQIAQKIFHNECSRQMEKLVWWNAGEDFASLGLGHFIWYPKGEDGPFSESFVDLLLYLRAKKVDMPTWLKQLDPIDCPWSTRKEFLDAFKGSKIVELRHFMYATFTYQVDFIIKRVEKSLYLVLQSLASPEKELAADNFYLVADSPDGVYALIDYINFKGEGINKSERYNGYGWGLAQVLLNMDQQEKMKDPVNAFVLAAKFVLRRRVENAPKDRNEMKWLPGWENRVNTYIGIEH